MARKQNPMRQSWLGEGQTEGWVPQRLELKVSPAWRHRPAPLMRLLERIEIEHLRHAGTENGNLIVTYDQFVEHRVSRRAIRPLLELAETLGLLEVRQSGEWVNDIRAPNCYRLTYLPENGGRRAPTDEWVNTTDDAARIAVARFQKRLGKKPTPQYPNLQHTSAQTCTEPTPTSAQSDKSPVPKRALSLISGGKPAKTGGAASIPSASEPVSTAGISGDARVLLRWMQGYNGLPTHRTAQQNLSGALRGDAIRAASQALSDAGFVKIEDVPNTKGSVSKVYRLTDAGRDPALLNNGDQFDLETWLSEAAH